MASSAIGATLAHAMLPTGSLVDFAGTSAPSGWLMCDGREVPRAEYSNLFAIIGTSYGVGNGSTTFNLPDFRGRFARYNDDMGTGAANIDTGRAHGSVQGQATKRPNTAFTAGSSSVSGSTASTGHSHSGSTGTIYQQQVPAQSGAGTVTVYAPSGFSPVTLSITANSTSHSHTSSSLTAAGQTITGGGDAETRPVNLACNRIIKY